MGHGMAKNIRQKIPQADTLVIYDVNKQVVDRFVKEFEGSKVIAATSPKEVAELSVRFPTSLLLLLSLAFH